MMFKGKRDMILSEPVVRNLASIFKYNYENTDMRDSAMSILKILDFDYKRGQLLYQEKEIEGYDDLPVSYRITPITLISFDVDCVETALNKLGVAATILSPILDSIGWSFTKEDGGYRLHFLGGANYEVWREPGIPWDYDMDAEDKNWREGSDWPDGIDLSKDIPERWV